METAASVLEFWFGHDSDDARVADRHAALWWSKDAAVDATIQQRFRPTLDAAASGSLDSWARTALGRLALIILTDQFTRNMFRNTPQSFAYDALARHWCRDGLKQQTDLELRPILRVFFYLPLEHSEELADQDLSVAQFRKLSHEVAPQWHQVFEDYLDFALHHREVIARFGRFPHRNAILKRESSADEQAFLLEEDSSF